MMCPSACCKEDKVEVYPPYFVGSNIYVFILQLHWESKKLGNYQYIV